MTYTIEEIIEAMKKICPVVIKKDKKVMKKFLREVIDWKFNFIRTNPVKSVYLAWLEGLAIGILIMFLIG